MQLHSSKRDWHQICQASGSAWCKQNAAYWQKRSLVEFRNQRIVKRWKLAHAFSTSTTSHGICADPDRKYLGTNKSIMSCAETTQRLSATTYSPGCHFDDHTFLLRLLSFSLWLEIPIACRISAICFELIPQLLATFFWHRLCTLSLHTVTINHILIE